MTDKELKALKEAFDFPEPDKKQEFLEEFSKLSRNNDKKRIPPIVMRFAAAAAMIAVIIGVLTHMPKDTTDFGNGNDGIVTVTETASVTESSAPPSAVTTTAAEGKAVKTTTSKVTGSAVTTTKTVTSSKTAAAQTEKASTSGTAVKTTAARTTAGHETKNDTTQKPVTTTTAAPDVSGSNQKDSNAYENSSSGRDMTVTPDTVYYLRDKTLTEDQLYPTDDNAGAPTVGKPINNSDMLKSLYDASDGVILANVDEMVYTSIDGEAFTAEDLSVISSYKGELNETDRITVLFSGGYVPAEKYMETHNDVYIDHPEEYSVYEKGESRFSQNEGAQYLFFIIKGGNDIPEGAYTSAAAGNIAVFRKIHGNYVSVDNGNYYFTEEMFDELR
ncbi:hypothetical protein [Ruminococcus flavefaciens]|uniref:hypothetical protein n=1 Tax=Ruminococcus flavefaciens TaxID=1265 RepID=UPI000464B27B|nr:hypothetical protein [Ruminococcus flavefaciens]